MNFLLGWLPGRCYVSFKEGKSCCWKKSQDMNILRQIWISQDGLGWLFCLISGMFLFCRHSMLPMPLKPSTWRTIWNMTPPRGAGVLKSSMTTNRVAPLSSLAYLLSSWSYPSCNCEKTCPSGFVTGRDLVTTWICLCVVLSHCRLALFWACHCLWPLLCVLVSKIAPWYFGSSRKNDVTWECWDFLP